jgi:iron complex transport system ATP-binding protein
VKPGPHNQKSTPGIPATPAALAAKGLEAAYGQDPHAAALISDLTLEVAPGELIAVVGPNGSGKSTLVRALSRTLKPRRGVALLDEEDLYRQVDSRRAARSIGVVPQETHVAFEFTVREVVAMGRAPHQKPFSLLAGESEVDRLAIDRALERAGISAELARRKISAVSGGERQRALIARALAQEARVLLLDEPTASLDLQHQTALLEWLLTLAHIEHRAVLIVLHDLNLAAAYADRIIVLAGGRIVAQGTPAEALTAETIEAVWGSRVWVRCHPASGRPYVLHLPEPFEPAGSMGDARRGSLAGLRVHILCGGGTGAPLMASLARLGAKLTAGALGQGDTDEEVAGLLGIEHPVVNPFSPLTDAAVREGRALADDAAWIVLTDVPIGDGNLATLAAALDLARGGRRLIAQQGGNDFASARDYSTGRRASELWRELTLLSNVRVAENSMAVIERLGNKDAQ